MLMWLQFAPVLLLALVATVLPGLPIAWMLRLRGMWGSRVLAVRRGGHSPMPSRTGVAIAARAAEQVVETVGQNRF